MRASPHSGARNRPRRRAVPALGCSLVLLGSLVLGTVSHAGAAGPLTYVGNLVGPGVADMYPVDITTFGNFYYVVDPGRYTVWKIDRTTGATVDSVGGHQSRATGLIGAARAIAVDSSGDVYVADTPNNRVEVFDPNLTYLRKWGSVGTAAGQFSMVYGVTVGIGKGPGGTATEVVYTTDGSRVQKFTTDGVFISQFGQGHLNQPRQLAVNPVTHDLYVASARDRQVVVFDKDGNEVDRFGSEGTGNGQFMGDIRGIDIDDAGYVYVSDDGNQRVQVFDSNGTYLFQFGNTGTGHQRLTDARGLTVTPDGIVCVADEWDFGLKEYGLTYDGGGVPNGIDTSFRFLFGAPPPAPGVNAPRGIAVNRSTGAIYTVDWWNQRLERFSSTGTYQLKWGQRGTKTEPGSINFAWDAAINPSNDRVYVANRESHEIEVFDANGGYVTRWGYRGTALGKFTFPQGVVFDTSTSPATLLVADSGNNRIQRFSILSSGKGSATTSYGSKGTGDGQFSVPTGIDVAPDGTIWVADTQNNRVQKRNPSTGNWTSYPMATGDTVGF
jgi:tripartite motif-containing protein 71